MKGMTGLDIVQWLRHTGLTYPELLEAADEIERLRLCEEHLKHQSVEIRQLREALEYARHEMWKYGFGENDLQPIRAALAGERP